MINSFVHLFTRKQMNEEYLLANSWTDFPQLIIPDGASCFSSALIFFIKTQLPLQCIFGIFLFTHRFLAMYVLLIW